MEVDMRIKRYTAESMRAALAQVRAEQGPDAVILSSRRIEDGIEVIAAVDYDEGLFAAAARQRTPEPTAPQSPAPVIAAAPATQSRAPVPTLRAPVTPSRAPLTAVPRKAHVPGKTRAPQAKPAFG